MKASRAAQLGAIALLALFTLFSPRAHALSCTASMSNVSYGNYTPWGGNVNVMGTLSYSCTVSLLDLQSLLGFTACFSITNGTHPQVMTDSAGDTLNHELYTDSGRSVIWGSRFGGTGSPILLNQGGITIAQTFTGTITVYAQLTGSQTTTKPSTTGYSQSFSGASTEVAVTGGLLGPPGSCSGGNTGVRFPFMATAAVPTQCDSGFSTSTLDFGSMGLLTSNVDSSSVVAPRCTSTTPYQIGLDNGANASGTTRRMKNGTSYITYDLYQDKARSIRWGNTLNVDTVSGTGTGSAQNTSVYGRAKPQTTPVAGTYTDTITATVTY